MEEKQSIKVVILCGGRGTRLVEETEYRPKPMVRIGPRPILTHIMDIYSGYGFKDFVLTLGYKGEMIKDYFLNFDYYTNDFTIDLGAGKVITPHTRRHPDWRITLADTGESTLTGGRIKRIEPYIDGDTFMVTYGDGVSDIDIPRLLAHHREMGKLATVTGVHPMTRFGELEVAEGLVLAAVPYEGEAGFTFPGVFGAIATAYFAKYGATREHLMDVTIKSHNNAPLNPKAQSWLRFSISR